MVLCVWVVSSRDMKGIGVSILKQSTLTPIFNSVLENLTMSYTLPQLPPENLLQ